MITMDGDNVTKMRVAYERIANSNVGAVDLGSPCLSPESCAELVYKGYSNYLQLLMVEQQARTADNLGALASTLDEMRMHLAKISNNLTVIAGRL